MCILVDELDPGGFKRPPPLLHSALFGVAALHLEVRTVGAETPDFLARSFIARAPRKSVQA
jgi:hypothetical protein